MYSTEAAYTIVIGNPIDKYELREKLALTKLRAYCLQFPTEVEILTLDADIQDSLLTAMYYQIQFDDDNGLLDNNSDIVEAEIGNFRYNTSTGYRSNKPTILSNTAKFLIRDTGICSNRISVKKNCSWLDDFVNGCG